MAVLKKGLSVIASGLIAIFSMGLFYGGPDHYTIRSLREIWNLGHIVYFALLAFVLYRILTRYRFSLLKIWATVLLLTLVWGLAIEFIQDASSHRSFDLTDVSRNFCGALLFLSFVPELKAAAGRMRMVVIRALVLGYLTFHCIPLTIALVDEAAARWQFPVLSDFETPFEIDRWTGNAIFTIATDQKEPDATVLEIRFGSERYSNASLTYLQNDWGGYRTFNMRILNTDTRPVHLTLRVHDAQHQTVHPTFLYEDRFNRKIVIQPGWNDIKALLDDIRSAPRKREMDMSNIANVSLFSTALKEVRTVYLDRIYLAR